MAETSRRCGCCSAAYYAAFALRFDGTLPPEYWHTFAYSAPLVVLTKLILLHHFGLYRCCWRYISVHELASLAKALSLGTLFITADYAIAVGFVDLPAVDHPVRLVHQPAGAGGIPGAAASAAGRPRARSCRWAARKAPRPVRQKILLYGAGDLGASLAEQITSRHSGTKKILGFIDDDPALST